MYTIRKFRPCLVKPMRKHYAINSIYWRSCAALLHGSAAERENDRSEGVLVAGTPSRSRATLDRFDHTAVICLQYSSTSVAPAPQDRYAPTSSPRAMAGLTNIFPSLGSFKCKQIIQWELEKERVKLFVCLLPSPLHFFFQDISLRGKFCTL